MVVCIGAMASADGGGARTFLQRTFGFTADQLNNIARGEAVARVLPASDRREIALLGGVRIDISAREYADRLADIVHFKRDRKVLQIGVFSTPPRPDDVRQLTLDGSALKALRSCAVGECDMRLSSDLISEARSLGGDGSQRVDEWFRHALVQYVNRYRAEGNAALMSYADTTPQLSLADEFPKLVASDRVLPEFPVLRRNLLEHPQAVPPLRDVIYWSKEQIGSAQVVTVTDMLIVQTPPGSPAAYVAASKQIYASRFFDSSLSLTVLVDDDTSVGPATYVVYLNRSRVDAFDGVMGGITRRIVQRHARGAVVEYLERVKTRLEAPVTGEESAHR